MRKIFAYAKVLPGGTSKVLLLSDSTAGGSYYQKKPKTLYPLTLVSGRIEIRFQMLDLVGPFGLLAPKHGIDRPLLVQFLLQFLHFPVQRRLLLLRLGLFAHCGIQALLQRLTFVDGSFQLVFYVLDLHKNSECLLKKVSMVKFLLFMSIF